MKTIFYSNWPLRMAITAAALVLSAQSAAAATLSLSAGSMQVSAGDLVTVEVLVNAGGQAINTAEGTIQFPTDMLEVLSLDKTNSVFSLWVADPSFSNQAGTVSFSGGLPSPGYSGASGDVLNVVFHAKKAGTATLSIADATVRANDGLGTDVLQSATGLQLSIAAPQSPPPAPAPTASTASAPAIKQVSSSAGSGTATSAAITAPQFAYDAASGSLSITVPSRDTGPLITEYDISIDGAAPVHLDPTAFDNGPYTVPFTSSGSHSVTFDVLRSSGEKSSFPGSFTVPVIGTPSIAPISSHMDRGAQLLVSGVAPEDDAQVQISIAKDGAPPAVFLVAPDSAGAFSLIGPIVQPGTYAISALGISAGGIESMATAQVYITVSDPSAISIGGFGLSLAAVLLVLLVLSAASLILAMIAWYRLYTYHLRRARLVQKMDTEVHRSIVAFKDDLEAHLDALHSLDGKRRISAQELKLRAEMKSRLAALGTYIEKELR